MEQPIPTEFTAFVHDIAIRALDNVGARAAELDTPLRSVARSWSKLSRADKKKFVTELIAAVQHPQEPQETKSRRAVKRFDPEEVKKTLPKKPKAVAKKKTKKASKESSSSRID